MFRRLSLAVNWAHPSAPGGGTFEDRRIDYLAHAIDELRILRQRLETGHSDHVWPLVTYRILRGPGTG